MSEDNWNKEKKKGAPPSGLFWSIEQSAFGQGDETAALDMIRNLRMAIAAINASPYEKNAHVIEFIPEGAESDSLKILEGLQAITAHNGLILLVRDSLSLAARAKADGVCFTSADKVKPAREAIGDDPIIAAHLSVINDIPEDIDLAIFSEAISLDDIAKSKVGASYTAMSALNLTNENCGAYVLAGCDFLNASEYMNTHEEGAAKAAVNMLYAIDLALEAPKAQH